jgi:hypothetical protein
MAHSTIDQNLLVETTPRCVEQKRGAPASALSSSADAPDDRSETDRYPDNTTHVGDQQTTAPHHAVKFDEQARRALASAYSLLIALAREKEQRGPADCQGPTGSDQEVDRYE